MHSIPGIQGVLAIKEVPVIDERPSIPPAVICKSAIYCNSPGQPFTSQSPPWQHIAYHRRCLLISNFIQSLLKSPKQLLTPYLANVISPPGTEENNGFGPVRQTRVQLITPPLNSGPGEAHSPPPPPPVLITNASPDCHR
ncbi:hypothetical protein E2C01_100446 [Portunus trituberculatus]|uniref:Uncharacterized protein n=1 Tax=Portunus trituberculatus TaxID=210409 RepID=A0A5B7K6Y5_PORTR|nr:hypothetical protein [Portunus trituberculatus]